MKTPMQEAIKIIEEAYNIEIDYGFKEVYLEKEKQVIIDAYTDAACDYGGDGQDSQNYYKEKFNQ